MLLRCPPRAAALAVCVALAGAWVGQAGLAATRAAAATREAGEVRALWVTRATLTSPAAIEQMVRAASASGFNTLVVQVRGRGDAYYRSTLEPRASDLASRPDLDPLAHTLTLAHRAGLKVHAWLAVNLVSSAVELPGSRQHIVYRQPDWLMVPRDLATEMAGIDPRSPEYVGRIARWTRAHTNDVEGLYTSPVHTLAAAHLANVVTEIAAGYDIDGLHLDYARFPNSSFDYSPATIAQFRQSVRTTIGDADRRRADLQETLDPLAYPNLFPAEWDAFRRARMTALAMRLRTAAKAARPDVVISAALVPDLERAIVDRLQDWRTWVDLGIIDILAPMAYTQDLAVFERQISDAQDIAGSKPVWAGIGAYRLSHQGTLQHIAAARRLNADGVILFSYDWLVTPPNSVNTLSELARAAFGTGPR